jgi:type IV fimbrial biogenesis protein FimT
MMKRRPIKDENLMRKHSFSPYRGVTLIELLITIVVLGILAAIAAPTMNDMFERRRLIGAAEAVYDILIMARSEAIKQSRDTYVRPRGVGTNDWCFGASDLPNPSVTVRCDCKNIVTAESDLTNPGFCTLLVHGEQNRVVTVVSSTDFRDVNLASSNRPLTRFNFVRGTAMGTNSTTTFATPGGYQLSVVVNVAGRVRLCTPSTAPKRVGGYPVCLPS